MNTSGGSLTLRRFAFTRVELLVTSTVVILLFGFVTAATMRAQRVARASECLSNLKHIGTGYGLWLHEFEDKLPWMVAPAARGSHGATRAYEHYQVMSNYLHDSAVLACPNLVKWRPSAASFASLRDLNVSYGIGLDAGVANPTPLLFGSIQAADFDLEGMGRGRCSRAGGVEADELPVWYGPPGVSGLVWSKTNHIGRGNVLFGDGTVSVMDDPALRRVTAVEDGAGSRLHFLKPGR